MLTGELRHIEVDPVDREKLLAIKRLLSERNLTELWAANSNTLCRLFDVEKASGDALLCIRVEEYLIRQLPTSVLSSPDILSGGTIAADPMATSLIKAVAPHIRIESAEPILARARLIKTQREISLLSSASAIADRVMEETIGMIRPGMSETEIARTIDAKLASYGISYTYFGTIVASGSGSGEPDHQSGARRLQAGDSITIDFGGPYRGYCCDITRTVYLGNEVPTEFRLVYETVREAQQRAFEAVRPGVRAGDIDRVARQVIERAGYGWAFAHNTGHGIGLEGHEAPEIRPGASERLEEGMVFSLEPGIYLPGKFGVRIEDIVVVGSDGAYRLNKLTHDLLVLNP